MSNRQTHVKFIRVCIIAFVLMSPYAGKANADSYTAGGGYVGWVWNYGISIGKSSETNGDYGISFGYDTLAEGNYSTAIGYQSKAGQRIDSNRTPQYSTAIGYKAVASEGNSVALGSEVNATKGGIAIGTLASAAQNGIAIGFGGSGSKTQAEYYGIAIGAGAQTTTNYATAIGNSAKSNALYALALGDSSTAFGENSVALGNYSATQESESYTVSVGNSEYGIRRRITNLERGINDTDAVNVSQLKQLGQNVSDVIGGNFSFSEGTWDGVTIDGTSYSNISEALEALSGSGSGTSGSLTEGSNIHFEQESDGTQSVHLNNDIKLNSVELAVKQEVKQDGMHAATTGQVHSLGSSIVTLLGGDFAIDPASGSISGDGFSVNGKDGLNLQDALTEAASSGGSGDGSWFFQANDEAADEIKHNDTLKFTDGSNLSIKHEADGSYSFNVSDNPEFTSVKAESVTVGGKVNISSGGIDMGGTRLTGLADGGVYQGSSDAVTGGQLWDTYQRMGTMENNIYREMDDLREDVNVVGAHAAALSGLHPIQYNPYEPTTLSAAVGAYRDEYAVAVGVFHYTRENVMFNLGASLCSDGDVMGRAGVSFAVGKSSDKKPRLASTMGGLQKQVIDMQAKLDGLEEKNARNEEIIRQNAEIMAQNEKLIRELTKRLEAKN